MLCGGRGWSPRALPQEEMCASTSASTRFALWPTFSPAHARRLAARARRRDESASYHSRRPSRSSSPPPPPSPLRPANPDIAFGVGKPVQPLLREAERDLLPGGVPNTPWRRLAYQLRQAPSLHDLLQLLRANRYKQPVWGNHHTALVVVRAAWLLYPQAVAGQPPSPSVKADITSILESLRSLLNKDSVRQIQGFHLARLLVVMAWAHSSRALDQLVADVVREVRRQQGRKLATVAAVDPPLYGRMIRALAQLVPADAQLWVELQRLTLAGLLQAAAERQEALGSGAAATGGSSSSSSAASSSTGGGWGGLDSGWPRIWGTDGDTGGRGGRGASPSSSAAPVQRSTPDASTTDLAWMAFGFAAADKALPQLFDAIHAAALSRPLPAEPDALAALLWAWARARLRPGALGDRVVEAFRPLLGSAPPRALGRLLWSMAVMGLGDRGFWQEAGETIVRRDLVFGSPQELVNVCWAFSQMGIKAERGSAELGTAAAAAGPPAQLGPNGGDAQQQLRGGSGGSAGGGGSGGRGRLSARARSRSRTAVQGRGVSDADASADTLLAASSSSSESPQSEVASAASPASLAADGSRLADEVLMPPPPQLPQPAAWPPPLQPLPLAAVLRAGDAASTSDSSLSTDQAGSTADSYRQRWKPDPASPYALYHLLAHLFMNALTSSNTYWSMSNSQLAVMSISFARAGFVNKGLYYTIGRMAMRRMNSLDPQDLVLLLTALARVRVQHDAFFEAAVARVEVRCHEFNSRQLASVLWAVQARMPHARYSQLVEVLRWKAGLQQQQPPRAYQHPPSALSSWDGGEYHGDGWAVEHDGDGFAAANGSHGNGSHGSQLRSRQLYEVVDFAEEGRGGAVFMAGIELERASGRAAMGTGSPGVPGPGAPASMDLAPGGGGGGGAGGSQVRAGSGDTAHVHHALPASVMRLHVPSHLWEDDEDWQDDEEEDEEEEGSNGLGAAGDGSLWRGRMAPRLLSEEQWREAAGGDRSAPEVPGLPQAREAVMGSVS